MSDRPRFVFDASTIVSALLFDDSAPGQALCAAIDGADILLSREIFEELDEVLGRDKFDRYVSREDRALFLQALVQVAVLVEPQEPVHVCRDPKDDKYLALAVEAQASCVVTSDSDLLVLKSFRGIPILTPSQFLARFAEDHESSR